MKRKTIILKQTNVTILDQSPPTPKGYVPHWVNRNAEARTAEFIYFKKEGSK